MDNNFIINKICCDENIETPDLSQLEEALDSELAKAEPDFELVDELTKTILELRNEPERRLDINEEIASVKRRGMKRNKRRKLPKLAWAAAAVCVLLAGSILNVPDAVGDNLFPSLIKADKDFYLDLNLSRKKNKEKYYENFENDPFGIKEYAREHKMEVCAPTYVTEGYTVFHIDKNITPSGDRSVTAHFRWHQTDPDIPSDIYLIMGYYEIDGEDVEGIKREYSENYELEETFLINGIDAYLFSDEMFDGFTYYELVFYDEISPGDGVYTRIVCGGLSHEETMKIFKSIC